MSSDPNGPEPPPQPWSDVPAPPPPPALPSAPPTPPAGYQQPYLPYGPPPPQTRTNGFAIASMVLGIVWIYWIGSILALVFGYVAKNQIDTSGGMQTGRGMAIAGIVLGWVGVGILLLILVLAAAGSYSIGIGL